MFDFCFVVASFFFFYLHNINLKDILKNYIVLILSLNIFFISFNFKLLEIKSRST